MGRLSLREDQVSDFAERAVEAIRDAQRSLLDVPTVEDRDWWGVSLRLDGDVVGNGALVVSFTEPEGRPLWYRFLLADAPDDHDEALGCSRPTSPRMWRLRRSPRRRRAVDRRHPRGRLSRFEITCT